MTHSNLDRPWKLHPAATNPSWSCTPAPAEPSSDAEEDLDPVIQSRRPCSILTQIGLPLFMGQVLAGLIALTAICSAFLVQNDISLPLSQNLFHYCLLCTCYVSVFFVRSIWRWRQSSTHIPTASSACNRALLLRIGLYVLAGFIDAHANWSIVAAYAFTSVTSVQLLDCLSIPTAMLLSFIFLRHRFAWTHYVAMVICLLGAGGMVAADVLANPSSNAPAVLNGTNANDTQSDTSRVILGDFLVILGAMAYAASNVLQQYLVMRYGIVDFLACAGVSAVVPTAIYSFVFERDGLYHLFTVVPLSASFGVVFACLAGYVAAMFLLYSLMPYVLTKTSAVLVNMSLLTADVYALLMGIFLFHNRFHALYILCFLAILFGVGLFSYRAPLVRTEPTHCCGCIRQRLCKTRLSEDGDVSPELPRPVSVYSSASQKCPGSNPP